MLGNLVSFFLYFICCCFFFFKISLRNSIRVSNSLSDLVWVKIFVKDKDTGELLLHIYAFTCVIKTVTFKGGHLMWYK